MVCSVILQCVRACVRPLQTTQTTTHHKGQLFFTNNVAGNITIGVDIMLHVDSHYILSQNDGRAVVSIFLVPLAASVRHAARHAVARS